MGQDNLAGRNCLSYSAFRRFQLSPFWDQAKWFVDAFYWCQANDRPNRNKLENLLQVGRTAPVLPRFSVYRRESIKSLSKETRRSWNSRVSTPG